MIPPADILLPWQRDFINDRSRFKIGMIARQGGKSFGSALDCVDDVMRRMAEGKVTTWVCLSRGERQSLELMQKVTMHAKAYGSFVNIVEDTYAVDDQKYKLLEVKFPNGSRIIGLPANADTARGFSANVLLDEYAFHADSRGIWKALYPTITRGYRVVVVSTPNGKNNKFYELMTSAPGWSRHVVDIHTVASQGLDINVDELRTGINDQDAWDQEYELKWLDEASAWLSYDLINSVESDQAGDPELYAHGMCVVGVDIGTRKDLFVIVVLELVGDVWVTRELITRQRIKFQEQDDLLAYVMGKYRVIRVVMDQTGMGEKPVEDAKRRHGQSRVEGLLFTLQSKLHLATLLKEAFQSRTVRIQMGDDALRRDLHKVKRDTTPNGNARFIADSDSDGHADRFWAYALALYGTTNRSGPMEYTSVSRDGDDETEDRNDEHGDWFAHLGDRTGAMHQ